MSPSAQIDELILGESLAIRRLRALVARVAPSSLPVLIEGPTGAGKELVAQALHLTSGRTGKFVPFNVCALADGMFEDALFGHTRGAFTGALSDRAGYLQEAHRGTVFLDEIGGLGMAGQSKLLRAIETGVYRPVGGRADRHDEFRLVAATNISIVQLVAAGRFRADLSYRLAGLSIVVPALHERREDIPILARAFLERTDPRGMCRLSEQAIGALIAHDWPGNVRELRHTVERAAILSATPVVGRDTVISAIGRPDSHAPAQREFGERRLIAELEAAGWNIEVVAAALGVHRATVYRRMRRMGLMTESCATERLPVVSVAPASVRRTTAVDPSNERDLRS